MPKPDVSSVTQEEVEALFDKDGDLREPGSDEDDSSDVGTDETEETEGEEEPESEEGEDPEEEESEDESEEESEEEDEEEESEEELDWDEVDDRYKSAHEAVVHENEKLRKDYGKLHSKYTREIQALREENGGTLEELRADATLARQWNSILDQHPDIKNLIEREIARKQDPYADLPDHLKEDPAIQFMLEREKRLAQELSTLREQVKPVKNWESQQQDAQNRQKLDGLLNQAAQKFKSMFGKDWTEDEKTEVLRYMVENQFYTNGKTPVVEVFGDRYEKALKTRQASALKAKAKKFGTRNKSVNTNRVSKASRDVNSAEEAIAMALAEQGYGQ